MTVIRSRARRGESSVFGALVAAVFAACAPTADGGQSSAVAVDASTLAEAGTSEAGTREGGRPLAHDASANLRACAESGFSLETVATLADRLNTRLPVDGPCFLASLPRPLPVVATSGTISAQPSGGPDSPRLFVLLPRVVVSLVPSGRGSDTVEFGEWVTPTRTLKAEIKLPVTSPLAWNAPFTRILLGSNTESACRACHRNEEPHATIPGAFVSDAFAPEPGTFVSLETLSTLHDACTSSGDASARCAMFHALFDFGAVEQGAFDRAVGTFLFQ
ncbi:MAG: hypothetical protein U0169_24435 [Polyangiaceae bacterium]